ncbi:hypothetical protein [Pseudomonas sp. NPDC087639]|uniref:hypothetical protein n=1 Tax=Pseudomonas sp. NPDC087639 TaxID=3364445 RepID=UPI0038286E4C
MQEPQQLSPARQSRTADGAQDSATHQAINIDVSGSTDPRPPEFIFAEMAALLTSAENSPEGIRYGKHGTPYVDMEGGTVMISKATDGSVRHTHPGESSPTGALLEQIPGARLWRLKEPTNTRVKRPQPDVDSSPVETTEAIAGPSKRPRQESASSDTASTDALMETLFSRQPVALDLSSGQWRNWAKATRPENGDAVEIDGAHYQIVSRGGQPDTGLVYLQHPGFAPESYDAFENMLRNEPSRQPKWALKRNGQWSVLESHPPFEMPMTQYVAGAFKYLSNHCSNTIARAVFDHSTQSGAVTNHALSMMVLTFRHWVDRVNNDAPPARSLLDPLMLLPKLPTQPDRLFSGGILTLPSSSAEAFLRIDFDPQTFSTKWNAYVSAATPANLRSLFITVLQDNGYSVNPKTRALQEGALIFHREGIPAVFVLKLPRITGNSIPRNSLPGSEISSTVFQARLSAAAQQALNTHLAQNEVVYLMGGTQLKESGEPTLFMVREG